MAKSLVKGLGLAIGVGLALGLVIKIGQDSVAPLLTGARDDLNLDPILDRLERMETTVAKVENSLKAPNPAIYTPALELAHQLSSQGDELTSLRAQILEIDRSHTS